MMPFDSLYVFITGSIMWILGIWVGTRASKGKK